MNTLENFIFRDGESTLNSYIDFSCKIKKTGLYIHIYLSESIKCGRLAITL